MRALRRKWLVVGIIALLVAGATTVGVWYWSAASRRERREARAPLKPQAPPDLEKLRDRYDAGVAAYRSKRFAEAAKTLSSFDFGGRDVEEYRLYYAGRSFEQANEPASARVFLSRLWAREPRAVIADDAGARLAGFYAVAGDWLHAASVYSGLAGRAADSDAAATARWGAIEANFVRGDVAAVLDQARAISIKNASSNESAAALGIVRSITAVAAQQPVPMTFRERLERAVGLLRDGEAQDALDELTALEPAAPAALRDAVELNRGLALNKLGKLDDSNKVLEPLTGGAFRIAIPALYTTAKNYAALAASINPTVTKTITVRQKVGVVKVRKGKGKKAKTITRPKMGNVRKTIQLVDLAKKAKKEESARLASERLRDLLQVRETAPQVRLEVLNTLIATAEAKNQDAYEQQLIAQVVQLDRWADPGLQHFWDKGWAAYQRGDVATAKSTFRFIGDTYGNPNVKRQADYWWARCAERAGDRMKALETYRRLANAPYEDVYALYAVSHGAARGPARRDNPTKGNRADWRDIAAKSMPQELRLAYELTALEDFASAKPEIDANASLANRQFADALRAQKLNNDGNLIDMYQTLRRAFPLLATVEQDSVPPYFLKMYYPVKYQEPIRRFSQRNGLDPYFVMALILQESYFNPHAKSRVGATGLMQLMPSTANEIGRQLHPLFSIRHLEDPSTNIELGTYHLKHLFALFSGNPQLVAASYNAGQGNVLKWRRAAGRKPMDEFLESIPFSETRNYVKRVTLLRSSYTRIAQ